MSLADEVRTVRERVSARLAELEPLVREYDELLKLADELGIDVPERKRSRSTVAAVTADAVADAGTKPASDDSPARAPTRALASGRLRDAYQARPTAAPKDSRGGRRGDGTRARRPRDRGAPRQSWLDDRRAGDDARGAPNVVVPGGSRTYDVRCGRQARPRPVRRRLRRSSRSTPALAPASSAPWPPLAARRRDR